MTTPLLPDEDQAARDAAVKFTEGDAEFTATGVHAGDFPGAANPPIVDVPSIGRGMGGGLRTQEPSPLSNITSYIRDYRGLGNEMLQRMTVTLATMDPSMVQDQAKMGRVMQSMIDMVGEDPAAWSLFRDASARYMQGENALMNQIQMEAMTGAPTQPAEALVRAAIETYEKRYGALGTAGRIFNESDVIRGAWDQASVRGVATVTDTADVRGSAFGAATAPTATTLEVSGAALAAPVLSADEITQLDRIEGRGASWAMKDGVLVVKLSDDPEGPTWTQVIQLEDGATIEDNADAALAVLQARAGTRHTLTPQSDDLPSAQSVLGAIMEDAGDVERWVARNQPGMYRRLRDGLTQAASTIPLPGFSPALPEGPNKDAASLVSNGLGQFKAGALRETLMIEAAQQFGAMGVGEHDAVTLAMGTLNAMPDDELESISSSLIGQYDSETAIRRIEAIEDERTFLGALFEDRIVPQTMDFLEGWEKAVYGIGIALTEAATLPIQGAVDVAEGRPADPVTLFRNAWDEVTADQTYAEYLGLDPESDGWDAVLYHSVNFGSQILFDPVTWLTPGGKTGFRAMTRALADPAQNRQWLMNRQPLVAWAKGLVRRVNRPQIVELLGSPELLQPDDLVRLFQIGATDFGDDVVRMSDATSEIFDILARNTSGGGGLWMPTGPQALSLRQSSLGMTRWFQDASSDVTDDGIQSMAALLVRANPHRSVRITDESWMGDTIKALGTFFPTQGDDYARYADEMIDAWRTYRGTDQAAQAVAVQMRIERVTQHIETLARGQDLTSVPTMRNQLDEVAKALRDAQTALVSAPDNAALAAQIDDLQRAAGNYDTFIGRLAPEYEGIRGQLDTARRELFDLRRQLDQLSRPGDRTILEDFTQRLFDDFAQQAGVPPLEGVPHPSIPGRVKRDWSVITGEPQAAAIQGQNLNTVAFGEFSDEWRRLGFGRNATETVLPVSPMELVAYAAASEATWAKVIAVKRRGLLNKTLNQIQYAFSASVLLNPITPVKAHIDEILRFYQLTGQARESTRALLQFVPFERFSGVGRRIAGVTDDITEASGRRSQYVRELGGLVGNKDSQWQMIYPKWDKKLFPNMRGTSHFESAERWVNGQLVQDPYFSAYARALTEFADDPVAAQAAFREWFEREGHQLAQQVLSSGRPMGWQEAWDTINNGLDLVAGSGRAPAEIRKALVDAASTADGRVAAPILRKMGPVPGQVTDSQSIFGPAFNALFGGPGQRRGAVFYDHFYETYKATVIDPLTSQGRVLNAQRLVDEFDITLLQAEEMLAAGRGSSTVRNYLTANNLYLPGDLESTAARWAAARSDDLMYSISASSVLGRRSTRLYPYGRAQVDFLDYWWRQLTSPTQIRFGSQIKDLSGTPLNYRVVDRLAKMGLLLDEDQQDQVGTPAWLANTWTFFPTRWDESFVTETIPSLGPVPIWAVNWIPDNPKHPFYPLRQAVQEISPSAAIFGDYENDSGNWLGNLVNNIMPTSGRSLRRQMSVVAGFAASQFGMGSPEQINRMFSILSANSEPSYYRDNLAILTGEWFAETNEAGVANAFRFSPGLDDTQATQAFDGMKEEAVRRAYSREATDQVRRSVGVPATYGSDNLYATNFAWLREVAAEWEAAGWITPNMLENFQASAARVAAALDDGEQVDPDFLRDYADVASDVYNSDLLPRGEKALWSAMHPEVFANTASSFEVDPALVPDEWRGAVIGTELALPYGPARTEAYRTGLDEGWIVPRDQDDVRLDRHRRAFRTASDVLKYVWEAPIEAGGMGREWADQTKASEQFNYTFPSDWRFLPAMENMGVYLPDEWRQGDGSWRASGAEIRDWLRAERKHFTTEGGFDISPDAERDLSRLSASNLTDGFRAEAARRGWDIQWDETADIGYYGEGLLGDHTLYNRKFDDLFGWGDPSEWEDLPPGTTARDGEDLIRFPDGLAAEDMREWFRQRFRMAVLMNPDFTEADYNIHFARFYGDLNWEPPQPPPDETDLVNRVTSDTPAEEFDVVDGDTLVVHNPDGYPFYFRLLGVNAPERGQDGYSEATENLRRLIRDADRVTVGMFEPETYGTTQSFRAEGPGAAVVDRDRVFVWLYVNGVPIYDPGVFTATNVRGQEIGGRVLDFDAILNGAPQGVPS